LKYSFVPHLTFTVNNNNNNNTITITSHHTLLITLHLTSHSIAAMDIIYIPAIAEIIERCKSAPFNVCNNPVNVGKAVKEDRIWQVYWYWNSVVPTTNRFKDAPRAVKIWAIETAVWNHFCSFSRPAS
jgi:hypothetical protein